MAINPVGALAPNTTQFNSIATANLLVYSGSFEFAVARPSIALMVNSEHGNLKIGTNGGITWDGPLTPSVKKFMSAFNNFLDLDTIGDRAAQKIYHRAIAKCLRMAQTMTQDEYIDKLQQELDTRNSKVVLMSLTNTEDEETE